MVVGCVRVERQEMDTTFRIFEKERTGEQGREKPLKRCSILKNRAVNLKVK
jgi:hypothetical protein